MVIPSLKASFVIDPFSGEKQLISDEIVVTVNPLPKPIPLSFTGAIGEYEMDIVAPENNLVENSLQLQIKITGDGNMMAMKPPIIQDTNEFRVLNAPDTQAQQSSSEQVFEYAVIPKVTGQIVIPPIDFSYFSRQLNDYVLLVSKPITFNATLENMSPIKDSFNVQEDIRFLAKNTMINKVIEWLMSSILTSVLLAINGLLLMIILVKVIPSKFKREKETPQMIKKKLKRQIQQLSEETKVQKMEQLLINVLNIYTSYDLSTINPKEIEKNLIKAEISDPIIKSAMQWIKNAQVLQFSNQQEKASLHSNADSLKRILIKIVAERN